MRKIVVALVICSFLFIGTSIYAQSTSGLTFSDWYRQQLHSVSEQMNKEVQVGFSSMKKSVETQEEQLLKEIEQKLSDFFLIASGSAKGDIENYKKDYLQRLEETKESLIQLDLMEVEQEMQETQMVIEKEAFDILSELLSDNDFDGFTEK
ncbi:hypothetical protein M3193_07880 [Sporosarcina luteola]|uniref:hypothetical protein n=1 Tax=Sporosarcina luteola TaxID=582850 RepID=UPI00203B1456|nr:hypothetical protein [Sporosarcina luteola]MCM3744060.1 hypothetical protein [Sporosarcina luteola]